MFYFICDLWSVIPICLDLKADSQKKNHQIIGKAIKTDLR